MEEQTVLSIVLLEIKTFFPLTDQTKPLHLAFNPQQDLKISDQETAIRQDLNNHRQENILLQGVMTEVADHLAVVDLVEMEVADLAVAMAMADDNLENNNSALTQSFAIFVTIKRFAK